MGTVFTQNERRRRDFKMLTGPTHGFQDFECYVPYLFLEIVTARQCFIRVSFKIWQ